MLKATKLNKIFALAIVLIFCFLFFRRTMYWYADAFGGVKAKVENYYAIVPKEDVLNRVYMDYLNVTNRKYFNGIITLNDGRFVQEKMSAPPLLEERAEVIIELNEYLKEKNTPFLFCRAPDPMRDNSELPKGWQTSITVIEDTADFMEMLNENSVDTLDFREEMTNEYLDFADVFYRGDHHWNIYGGFFAYEKLAKLLNAKYGFNIDEKTYNIDEYDTMTFHNTFLGSASTRIGDPRLKEDVTVFIPKYKTEFEVYDKASVYPIKAVFIDSSYIIFAYF